MELDPQEKSRVWWGGAMSNAIKGIPAGIGSAILAAAFLAFVVFPLLPALAPTMGSFLTFAGAPSFMPTIAALGAPFFPIPIIFFNTAITVAMNALTGGDAAVQAYHQSKHNQRDESKIIELDARERVLERDMAGHSHVVGAILARGGMRSSGVSHADAQLARSNAADNSLPVPPR